MRNLSSVFCEYLAPVLSCLPPRLVSRDAEAGEGKNGGHFRNGSTAIVIDGNVFLYKMFIERLGQST